MPLRPGQVRDAITTYLSSKGEEGASVSEIHDAVAGALGAPVASSSVRSYLRLHTPGEFVRMSLGHYRLDGNARV